MENNNINKIIKKIKKRMLTVEDYKFIQDSKGNKLLDKMLLYNNGKSWKIIPLKTMLAYPIIYDKYETEKETYDITIVLCPITLMSTIFKGLFKLKTYQNDKMILSEINNDKVILPIDMGIKINSKFVIEKNKRLVVNITTLRNAMMTAPDANILTCDKKKKSILKKSYYKDLNDIDGNVINGLLHPKTLVYVIQFKHHSTPDEKTKILMGKNISEKKVTGYDFSKSGISSYLTKYQEKIIGNEGFIMPMLWYMAKKIYSQSEVINVSI
jgi:hypothetical protein